MLVKHPLIKQNAQTEVDTIILLNYLIDIWWRIQTSLLKSWITYDWSKLWHSRIASETVTWMSFPRKCFFYNGPAFCKSIHKSYRQSFSVLVCYSCTGCYLDPMPPSFLCSWEHVTLLCNQTFSACAPCESRLKLSNFMPWWSRVLTWNTKRRRLFWKQK